MLHPRKTQSHTPNPLNAYVRILLLAGFGALCGLGLAAPSSARPSTGEGTLVRIFAQTGGACGAGVAHCTVLTWTASSSAAGCVSPCTLGYNVFRGTTAGGETTAPINAAVITGTGYIDPVTLTNSQQTFFYTIQAVETSGGVTVSSAPSAEVSDSFPGIPAPPTSGTAVAH